MPFVKKTIAITQAYLCASPQRTVRLRIKGEAAFITIKGPSNANGFSRCEFEYSIPLEDAKEMISLCESDAIIKERHYIDFKGHLFEVDVFHGKQEGLIMAEIELDSEEEAFEKPSWLGEEVTGRKEYYNAYMALNSLS